jgi:hypothetical protein
MFGRAPAWSRLRWPSSGCGGGHTVVAPAAPVDIESEAASSRHSVVSGCAAFVAIDVANSCRSRYNRPLSPTKSV